MKGTWWGNTIMQVGNRTLSSSNAKLDIKSQKPVACKMAWSKTELPIIIFDPIRNVEMLKRYEQIYFNFRLWHSMAAMAAMATLPPQPLGCPTGSNPCHPADRVGRGRCILPSAAGLTAPGTNRCYLKSWDMIQRIRLRDFCEHCPKSLCCLNWLHEQSPTDLFGWKGGTKYHPKASHFL